MNNKMTVADAAKYLGQQKAKYEKMASGGDKYKTQHAALKLKRIESKLAELRRYQQSMNGNQNGQQMPMMRYGGLVKMGKGGSQPPKDKFAGISTEELLLMHDAAILSERMRSGGNPQAFLNTISDPKKRQYVEYFANDRTMPNPATTIYHAIINRPDKPWHMAATHMGKQIGGTVKSWGNNLFGTNYAKGGILPKYYLGVTEPPVGTRAQNTMANYNAAHPVLFSLLTPTMANELYNKAQDHYTNIDYARQNPGYMADQVMNTMRLINPLSQAMTPENQELMRQGLVSSYSTMNAYGQVPSNVPVTQELNPLVRNMNSTSGATFVPVAPQPVAGITASRISPATAAAATTPVAPATNNPAVAAVAMPAIMNQPTGITPAAATTRTTTTPAATSQTTTTATSPVPATNVRSTNLLRRNAEGYYGDVTNAQVQSLLEGRYGFSAANGKPFDPNNESDVRLLQQRLGITVDGKFGPATLAALQNSGPMQSATRADIKLDGGSSTTPADMAANLKPQLPGSTSSVTSGMDYVTKLTSMMAPYGDNLINQRIINRMADIPLPVLERHLPKPQRISLDDTRNRMSNSNQAGQRSVRQSTANAGTARAVAAGMNSQLFDSYGKVGAQEELMNQQVKMQNDQINAGISARNTERWNQFLKDKLGRDDLKKSLTSQNVSEMFTNLQQQGYERALMSLDKEKLQTILKMFDQGVVGRTFFDSPTFQRLLQDGTPEQQALFLAMQEYAQQQTDRTSK